MSHAIIRGKNGRPHEVDFRGSPVHIEVHASDETVEIFVEAVFDTLPYHRRLFVLNMPRYQLSQGVGDAVRRATKPS